VRLDVAGALKRMGGLSGLYQRAARDFLHALPGQLVELQAALASELLLAGRLAHTLKGTAAMLGAMGLSETAAALEKQCLAGVAPADLLASGQALGALAAASSSQLQAALALFEAWQPAGESGQPAERLVTASPRLAAPQASALHQGLTELKQLLAADDVTALEKFAELAPALAEVPQGLLAPLEEALQELELGQGLQACGAISAWLEGVSA
jgi:HPt (histidine-containing phosphotransfer) domain-containing protein